MSESLGKAVLELEANLTPFERNIKAGKNTAQEMEHALDAVAAIANIAESALNDVKMSRTQGVETKATAESIISGVRGISEESRAAARELDDVTLDEEQAAKTRVVADQISGDLDKVTRNARQAKRQLDEVALAGGVFDTNAGRFRGDGGRFVPGGGGGLPGNGNENPGVGVGPFGSGFGRIGLLGAAIGGGTLLGPAAGPGAAGLLAAIPVLATSGAGALGVLALAFQGVGKAIGGDKKAFDDLGSSAQGFVLTVRSLDGWFDKLKETAGASLFPGLTAGLKAALSPGTIGAITAAVQAFGTAIGNAGAAWGRYFGSAEFQSIFGPLMAAGARNLTLMSDAALHLFDAIGVLARAAIPFTQWMVQGIDAGARWADAFLHAKDSTGALGGALHEAETSLRLVGGLFVALGRAVFALGEALYPVSKIAVKDLTDGLDYLAGVFDRNKQTIRDIVGGALSALVSVIRTLWPIVAKLAGTLNSVVDAMGGWKSAFELIIGGFLAAKFVALAGTVGGYITKLRDARLGMLALGSPEVLLALAAAAGAWLLLNQQKDSFNGTFPATSTAIDDITGVRKKNAQEVLALRKKGWSDAKIQAYLSGEGKAIAGLPQFGKGSSGDISMTSAFSDAKVLGTPGGGSSAYYSEKDVYGLLVRNGVPKSVAANLAKISAHGEDPSGNPAALNNNAGTGDYSMGLFQENFYGKMGPARVKQFAPQFGLSPNMSVSAFTKWLGQHPDAQAKIAYQIYQSQGYGAWTTAAGLGIYSGSKSGSSPWGDYPEWTKNTGAKKPVMPTGANLLSEALRNALQAAKDNATTTSGSTAAMWLRVELDDLEKAKKDLQGQLVGASGKRKAAIQQELRTIDGSIASVNQQITSNLKGQAQAIKSAFSSQVSTAKSNISSAASTLKATLDAQLQQRLQSYIETVLGPKFFQGTDAHGQQLQTPLEKQLADMQSADTLKQLDDAIKAATDPATRVAAERSKEETLLAIDATKQRQQADYDYAQAVKAAQADYAEQQRQLNLQIDTFAKGLADGTTKLSDLGGIVGAFGLSLTADDGIITDFGNLQSAVQALARVLAQEALKLVRVGDQKDANDIQSIINKIGGVGLAGLDPAIIAAMGGLPKLDVGGEVLQTGVAIVHRGEIYSGVGANRASGVTIQTGPVYGAIDQETARRWVAMLKTELDRHLEMRTT